MNVAVFADVHGKLLLCFQLCAQWQQETGERVDLILQAGDLGAFPDLNRIDRATRRHAEKDPGELGFLHHFCTLDPTIAAILAQTQCPLVFVRGNHEDHRWLDKLESTAPGPVFEVDIYKRVYCLKTGWRYNFTAGTDTLHILGIGRVAPRLGDPDITQPQYIQQYEMEQVYNLDSLPFDILLSHDSAHNAVTPDYGMEEIRLILDSYQPSYHFYGHTGEPCTIRESGNGHTLSCKLSDLSWDWDNHGHLLPGAMGLLRWETAYQHHFEIIERPWLHEYTVRNWLPRKR